MTFEYEKFDVETSREIRIRVKRYQTVMSEIHGQVIDRNRGVIFLVLGGQGSQAPNRGEPPTYYAMEYQHASDSWVVFEGFDTIKKFDEKIVININLNRLAIPTDIKVDLQQIQTDIHDAFLLNYRRFYKATDCWLEIKVQFPESVSWVEHRDIHR